MFITSDGDRPNVRNVVIVMTDGRSGDEKATWAEAKALRDGNVTIIVVGIGINQHSYRKPTSHLFINF